MKSIPSAACAVVPFVLVFLAAGVAVCAGVPQAPDEVKQTRLSLGADKGARGDQVLVPVILSPATGVQIRKITAEIRFAGESLRFEEAKASGTDTSKIELHVEAEPGETSSPFSRLTVRIASTAEEGIQSGVVALLTFKVPDDAPVGETVSLEIQAQGFTLSEQGTPLVTTSGEVQIVLVPAVFACYFYMH